MRLLVHWLINAASLFIVAQVVPGFHLSGFKSALIAAVVIGLINTTLGLFLKFITFPFALITFGLFWVVINALMLELATKFVPGFEIRGFWAAFIGAIVLSIVNMLLRWLVGPKDREAES